MVPKPVVVKVVAAVVAKPEAAGGLTEAERKQQRAERYVGRYFPVPDINSYHQLVIFKANVSFMYLVECVVIFSTSQFDAISNFFMHPPFLGV